MGTSYARLFVVAIAALLFVGLILAANASRPVVSSAHVSGDGKTIELPKAHPPFADQAATLQQAAQQQWADAAGALASRNSGNRTTLTSSRTAPVAPCPSDPFTRAHV